MFQSITGTQKAVRWGALGLVVAIGALALSTTDADARGRRRAARAGYAPPYAAMVVDHNSGAVLHATNADALRHPASLTKIMTLYLLFERLEKGELTMDSRLPVSVHAQMQAPTKLGLKAGQTISVDEAIKGLVTRSANDAAVVIAEALDDSEEDFAEAMTRKARALGMRNTVYHNASGLPDPEQVTTARDQVILGRAIQDRFPKYYRLFSTQAFNFRGKIIRGHNRLVGHVEGVDGIKTGYTRASGFNLVSSIRRGNRHIVAAVLGGRSARVRDAQMRTLLENNIMLAATSRTAPLMAEAPSATPPRIAAPVAVAAAEQAAPASAPAPVTVAALAAAPLPVAAPARAEIAATAAVRERPAPERIAEGSTDPIRPVAVKTIAVRPAAQAPARVKVAALGAIPAAAAPAVERDTKVKAAAPARAEKHPVGWIIQVGAFDDESDAKSRLEKVQSRARALLAKADPFTEKVQKGDKALYRARFAGLAKDQAEAACRTLKRSDISCISIKN